MDNEIKKSVIKNTSIQMIQQIVTWSTSFLLMLFLPRYLGPNEYGKFYLASSIAGIFLILIDFDGKLGIAKRISRNKENTAEMMVNSIAFRFVFWVFSLVSMIIFAIAAKYPPETTLLIFIFGLEMLWLGIRTVFNGIFLGYEALQYSSIPAIIERVFVSLVGILALILGAKALGITIISVLGTALSLLFSIKFIKKYVLRLPRYEFKSILILIKQGLPFFFYTIFAVIYFRIDTVMLSMMTTNEVVGWYGASYKFFDMLAFVPSIFSITMLPILSKLSENESERMRKTTERSTDFMLIAGIPIAVGLFIFSRDIINLFYGLESYYPSVVNLKLFAIGLPLVYIDMILGTAIIAADKQKQWAIVAFFAIFINVGLNFILIPIFQQNTGNGGIGASIATIITEFFILISATRLLPAGVFQSSLLPTIFKILASTIIMFILLLLMNYIGVPWLIQIFIGGTAYILAILKLRTFTQIESNFIKNTFLNFFIRKLSKYFRS